MNQEFKPELIDLKESATYNVWLQLGINLKELKNDEEKIDVTTHYFPEEEQDKLIKYMRENYRKLKAYNNRKKVFDRSIPWEVLSYFPSMVKKK